MYTHNKIQQLISDYYYADETYINPYLGKTKIDDNTMLRLIYLLSSGTHYATVKFQIDLNTHKTIMNIFLQECVK